MTSKHTLFAEGEESPCPRHRGLCAYTGQEPDRCPECHALLDRHPAHQATRSDAPRRPSAGRGAPKTPSR